MQVRTIGRLTLDALPRRFQVAGFWRPGLADGRLCMGRVSSLYISGPCGGFRARRSFGGATGGTDALPPNAKQKTKNDKGNPGKP